MVIGRGRRREHPNQHFVLQLLEKIREKSTVKFGGEKVRGKKYGKKVREQRYGKLRDFL